MPQFDDAVLDERVRQYYGALAIPPRRAHIEDGAPFFRSSRRWIAAAAGLLAVLGGTAVIAQSDLRATAIASIEHTLSLQFKLPVPEVKQVAVDPAAIRSTGLELPRGLPSGAQLVAMRKVDGNDGWISVTYRVPGRSGEATFEIVSVRKPPVRSGVVVVDDSGPPLHTRFASWKTANEHVSLVARGDVFSDGDIRHIKAASQR